jgi:hypothetical protein
MVQHPAPEAARSSREPTVLPWVQMRPPVAEGSVTSPVGFGVGGVEDEEEDAFFPPAAPIAPPRRGYWRSSSLHWAKFHSGSCRWSATDVPPATATSCRASVSRKPTLGRATGRRCRICVVWWGDKGKEGKKTGSEEMVREGTWVG